MGHINDDDDDDVFVCGCDVLNDSLNCNVFVSSKYNRIIVVIIVGHFLFPLYRYYTLDWPQLSPQLSSWLSSRDYLYFCIWTNRHWTCLQCGNLVQANVWASLMCIHLLCIEHTWTFYIFRFFFSSLLSISLFLFLYYSTQGTNELLRYIISYGWYHGGAAGDDI